MFSGYTSSENSTKGFFAQLQGYLITDKTLRVSRRHTLKTMFQVTRVAVNHRKLQKHLKKISRYSRSTLMRRLIYDTEKLSTAFPSDSVGVTKPRLLFVLVHQDEKSSRDSTSLSGTYFGHILGKKSVRKFARAQKLCQSQLWYTLFNHLLISSAMHPFDER